MNEPRKMSELWELVLSRFNDDRSANYQFGICQTIYLTPCVDEEINSLLTDWKAIAKEMGIWKLRGFYWDVKDTKSRIDFITSRINHFKSLNQ